MNNDLKTLYLEIFGDRINNFEYGKKPYPLPIQTKTSVSNVKIHAEHIKTSRIYLIWSMLIM
jgi:hypothetical protein